MASFQHSTRTKVERVGNVFGETPGTSFEIGKFLWFNWQDHCVLLWNPKELFFGSFFSNCEGKEGFGKRALKENYL